MGGQVGGQVNLSLKQKEVLELIRQNPTISRKELGEKLDINTSAVQKHIEALKKSNYIKRVGKTKGHWNINDE